MTKNKKIAISALVISLYVAVMYMTASFSFGAVQIRVATSLYALAYIYPFLVLPLSLANMLSNVLSGNILDIIGGFFVGFATAGAIFLTRKIPSRLGSVLVILCIAILPSIIVPIWLSVILALPYWVLVLSLFLGQIIPSIMGYFLIIVISKRVFSKNTFLFSKEHNAEKAIKKSNKEIPK